MAVHLFPDHAPPQAITSVGGEAFLGPVLELVRRRQGVDFSGYRVPTLQRRVLNRMIAANASSIGSYLERLRTDPDEPRELVASLTIKIGRFFRNAHAFEAVSSALARVPAPPAVWSAGCGHGEEPYSLAIVLAELGLGAASSPDVVATDVDPAALATAARGCFPEAAFEELPDAYRRRYLDSPDERGGSVSPELHRRVAFCLHDLASATEAPDGRRFALVSCRNTLIYFRSALQERVERLLRDSLAPGGLLWLGEAEWPAAPLMRDLEVVDRKARLFRLINKRETT